MSPHTTKNEKVEKVHDAKDYQHHSNFSRQRLNTRLRGFNLVTKFERQANVTKINQVKADHQQMIDRICQRLVTVKDINQKHPSVFVERASYPDGQRNANGQVNQVCGDSYRHSVPP